VLSKKKKHKDNFTFSPYL